MQFYRFWVISSVNIVKDVVEEIVIGVSVFL